MYMNSRVFVSIAAALMLCGNAFAQRTETLLEKGWRFHLGEADASASSPGFDDSSWEEVTVPHDWAIYGPFDVSNDLQTVAVTQNFENEASMKTGRTGGLPYVGIGCRSVSGLTDTVLSGAMSQMSLLMETMSWQSDWRTCRSLPAGIRGQGCHRDIHLCGKRGIPSCACGYF